jgi:hypothetical protein
MSRQDDIMSHMSIITIEQLKTKFESGDWPRSTDYMDLIDTLAALPENTGGGTSVLNGSGVPSNETGTNGDFYIDTVNYDIYGPKSSGVWGSATSLVGPTGSTGATGAAGTNGNNGANGETGPAGPGVSSGGTTGQYLTKVDGTNYNTQWSTLDLSGKQDVVVDVSSTEIGYLNGVTSAIQTQLNAKATPSDITTAINNLIDGAPAALDTLNELAAAINDDASYASTITTALGTKAPIDSPNFTGTVSGITKTMVGLGSVDNTTDANKPVSTATQTALDAKLASAAATAITRPILISASERTTVSATAATGTINFDAATQGVLYYTVNSSANWTLNIRGTSGSTLSSILAVGDSMTVVFLATNGTTAYYPTAYQIDGSAVTPKWQGGIAPNAGNASSIDSYSLTIIKTDATPVYTVIGSQTRFA